MIKYSEWLNESKADLFFTQLVKNIREEGNRRFKKTTVSTRSFSSMEIAKDSFNSHGGPQSSDYVKNGPIKELSVVIHFDPKTLKSKFNMELGDWRLFDTETIELVHPMGDEHMDYHSASADERPHLLNKLIDDVYYGMLKKEYPIIFNSRKYGI